MNPKLKTDKAVVTDDAGPARGDVLILPWGLSIEGTAPGALAAAAALIVKFTLVACAVVFVETAQSRLRFYRYQEPLAASFLLALLAVIGTQLG